MTMMDEPSQQEVDQTLARFEHPRVVARRRVADYRTAKAAYDWTTADPSLKQIIYCSTVRYHKRVSWQARLLGWLGVR
jgi:hypothetical protein